MSFTVVFILIAFAMCNMCKSEDERKAAIEGTSVQLHFPYPCNSTRFTLQYRNRVPFYTMADTESIVLPPEQVHRFTFKKTGQHDHCSLNFRIKPVLRNDAGTYIFFTYGEDGMYLESFFKRIGLRVDFPPGNASCTLNEEYMFGDWVALNCMAPVGTLSGQIDCYQNGERMPPITEPSETHTHLKQSILVTKMHPVFCCTSTRENTQDLCDCNDFQWNLANDKDLSSVIHLCDPTTSVQDQTHTSKAVSTPSKLVSTTTTTTKTTTTTTIKINSHNGSVPQKYVVILCFCSILIIGLVISVVALISKLREAKEIKETPQGLNNPFLPLCMT